MIFVPFDQVRDQVQNVSLGYLLVGIDTKFLPQKGHEMLVFGHLAFATFLLKSMMILMTTPRTPAERLILKGLVLPLDMDFGLSQSKKNIIFSRYCHSTSVFLNISRQNGKPPTRQTPNTADPQPTTTHRAENTMKHHSRSSCLR